MNYDKTFQNIIKEFDEFFENIDSYLENDSRYYFKSLELQSKLSLLIKEINKLNEISKYEYLIKNILIFLGDFVGTGIDYEISDKLLNNLKEQSIIQEKDLQLFYDNISIRQG